MYFFLWDVPLLLYFFPKITFIRTICTEFSTPVTSAQWDLGLEIEVASLKHEFLFYQKIGLPTETYASDRYLVKKSKIEACFFIHKKVYSDKIFLYLTASIMPSILIIGSTPCQENTPQSIIQYYYRRVSLLVFDSESQI